MWLGLAIVCVSCGGLGEAKDPNHCLDTYCVGGEASLYYTAYGGRALHDVLVVIDDSVPSSARAPVLEHALRDMMWNLQDFPGDTRYASDLNLALVPASLAANGIIDDVSARLWSADPACLQPSGPYLHDSRFCDSPSNYQGTASDALACAALHMPATGQPSRPMETLRALFDQGGLAESSGFRRKDAQLFLVLVAADDDPAVATDAQRTEYADFLGKLAQDPYSTPAIAVIAPAAAQRLAAFANIMEGAFDDIAADSWSGPAAITQPGESWRDFACIDWPVVDADPTRPGFHPDCYVAERDVSAAGVVESPIPFCRAEGADPDPCWKTTWNPNRCPNNAFEFKIVRSEFACLPSYSIKYQFTCATKL